MRVLDHKALKQHASKRRGHRSRIGRWLFFSFAFLLLLNGLLLLAYHNKAFPGDSLGGVAIGNRSFSQIEKLDQGTFLPSVITVHNQTMSQQVSVQKLGVGIDWSASIQALKKEQSWVPLFTYFLHRNIPVSLHTDTLKLEAELVQLQPNLSQKATDAHVVFLNGSFSVAQAQNGSTIDAHLSAPIVSAAVAKGSKDVVLVSKVISGNTDESSLSADVQSLQKQLSTRVTFNHNGTKITPTSEDEGAWFTPSGQTMSLSGDAIGTYIDKVASRMGIGAGNRVDLITAVQYALGKNISMDFTVSSTNAVSRTYCTAVDGVSESELADLIGKLAATYADVRGWNDGGKIAFEHVTSGCQYTVWLAAPSLMTTFGSICDDYYNCQVGNGVVVNNDRWLHATDPWNKTGQSLEVYRELIIDHESGHRLGFLDNPTCPGQGQPAPVMMQQSINLKGCVFNTWPTQQEFDELQTTYIPALGQYHD